MNDGTKLWLWKNGEHYLAFEHLYPCFTPGGDPMTLGAPAAHAIFKVSFAASTTPQAAAEVPGFVPEGFWLAPMEPDDALCEAIADVKRRRLLRAIESDDHDELRPRGMVPACAEEFRAGRDSWLARHPAAPTASSAPAASPASPPAAPVAASAEAPKEWLLPPPSWRLLAKAAINLLWAIDEKHDSQQPPLKYSVPYGAVNGLRIALGAAEDPLATQPPSEANRSRAGGDVDSEGAKS